MSGVIAQQGQNVVDAYKPYFKNVCIEQSEEGWVLISASNS